MTAQIRDSLELDGKTYEVAEIRGRGLFDPALFGLEVVTASTQCWRGYVCTYSVSQGLLQLDRIEARVGRYDGDRFEAVEPPIIAGREAERTPGPVFNTLYSNVGLPIPFSGRLSVGFGAIEELEGEPGIAPAQLYDEALGLDFAEGRLLEIVAL